MAAIITPRTKTELSAISQGRLVLVRRCLLIWNSFLAAFQLGAAAPILKNGSKRVGGLLVGRDPYRRARKPRVDRRDLWDYLEPISCKYEFVNIVEVRVVLGVIADLGEHIFDKVYGCLSQGGR